MFSNNRIVVKFHPFWVTMTRASMLRMLFFLRLKMSQINCLLKEFIQKATQIKNVGALIWCTIGPHSRSPNLLTRHSWLINRHGFFNFIIGKR